MIAHQTVVVDHHTKVFVGVGERRQKGLIRVGRERDVESLPQIHDMEIRILVSDADGSGHRAA